MKISKIIKIQNENRTEGCVKEALNYVSKYGHSDIVKFLQIC
jgi:hypothetical protein